MVTLVLASSAMRVCGVWRSSIRSKGAETRPIESGHPTGWRVVAESGIHSREDVKRLEACGAGAILVGESLMRETNLCGKAHELLGVS